MFRNSHLSAGFFLMVLLSLSWNLQAQNAPVVTVCQLSDFTAGPNGHAVYLHYLPGAITPRYRWDTNGGTFTIFADSTARVTGRVFNDSLPNWQWDVEFWFINQKDFATWDSLGRDVKIEYAPGSVVQANKQDYLFWEFDSTRSRLFGVPGTFYDGDTLLIRHNPPNREFGLQYGLAANAKNGNFGLSAWFLFSGAYSGYGDINVNASCGPAPCDVDIVSESPSCLTDSTFTAIVDFTGTGGPFIISDDQGTPPQVVNIAGVYQYGSYDNGDSVHIFVSDSLAVGCADSSAVLTADCTPAPVCDVQLSGAVPTCVTDSTFEIAFTISGTGTYDVTDNQGNSLPGLTAGTYTSGPYLSNSVIELYAADVVITGCADTVMNLTADCTPAPVCDVQLSSAAPSCITDSTFEVSFTISGTGSYDVTDNQGSAPLTGLSAGTYVIGPYQSNTVVELYATDPMIPACADTIQNLSADCTPVQVCTVAIDSASAACVTDTTFAITVSFSGVGPFDLSDDKGTAPLTGLTGGTYTYGSYSSNEIVTVFLSDPSIAGCVDSVSALTQTCIPVVPVCDLLVDTIYADCASDTSFNITVTILGTGSNYQISDDQGSAPIAGLSAGTYTYGNYFNSTNVLLTVTDLTLAGCDTTIGPLTADCTPVAVCDLAIDTVYATCVSDSTFDVTINLLGSGQFYQVFDNQGSMPLFPVGAGMYTFGPFLNGTQVTITASDLAIFNCFATAGPISETCGSGSSLVPSANIWATSGEDVISVSWEARNPTLINGFFLEKTVNPEVESSWQTLTWMPVTLPVATPAMYDFDDTQVSLNQEYFYRLRIVPMLGADIYSDEVSALIEMRGGVWIGEFFPNPTDGQDISFGIQTDKGASLDWMLYNSAGVRINDGFLKVDQGDHVPTLKLGNLNSGFYYLQVWSEGVMLRSRKIVVVN